NLTARPSWTVISSQFWVDDRALRRRLGATDGRAQEGSHLTHELGSDVATDVTRSYAGRIGLGNAVERVGHTRQQGHPMRRTREPFRPRVQLVGRDVVVVGAAHYE